MSEDHIEISIGFDKSKAESDAETLQQVADRVTSRWARIRDKIIKEARGLMYTMRSVIGVIRSVFRYFGIALNPIQESIVTAIMTSLTAAIAIHRTMEAATMGVAGVVTIGLSALSIGMSLAAIAQASRGMEEARAHAEQSIALVESLEMLVLQAIQVGI